MITFVEAHKQSALSQCEIVSLINIVIKSSDILSFSDKVNV